MTQSCSNCQYFTRLSDGIICNAFHEISTLSEDELRAENRCPDFDPFGTELTTELKDKLDSLSDGSEFWCSYLQYHPEVNILVIRDVPNDFRLNTYQLYELKERYENSGYSESYRLKYFRVCLIHKNGKEGVSFFEGYDSELNMAIIQGYPFELGYEVPEERCKFLKQRLSNGNKFYVLVRDGFDNETMYQVIGDSVIEVKTTQRFEIVHESDQVIHEDVQNEQEELNKNNNANEGDLDEEFYRAESNEDKPDALPTLLVGCFGVVVVLFFLFILLFAYIEQTTSFDGFF